MSSQSGHTQLAPVKPSPPDIVVMNEYDTRPPSRSDRTVNNLREIRRRLERGETITTTDGQTFKPRRSDMEWLIILLPVFIEMFQNCETQKRTTAQIEDGLNDPGPRERWGLRIIIKREMGLRGRALHAKVREGMTELRQQDTDDIQALMAEAFPAETVA